MYISNVVALIELHPGDRKMLRGSLNINIFKEMNILPFPSLIVYLRSGSGGFQAVSYAGL